MFHFAICDDEPLMRQEISDRLSAYMKENNVTPYRVSHFSSGRALLESGDDYDLIFLDIQMERPDGMETAEILRRQGKRSLLVFVTVLRECVFDAFEAEAHDYLLKPLDSVRFRRSMDRAVKVLNRRTAKSVMIRQGASCEVVPMAQIVYCEVQGRKLYIHRDNGEVIDCYGRLDEFARRVDGRFFRCHRSYLVNLDYVRGYRAGQAILSRDGSIPVSRLRESGLTQALLRCMKERDS